MTKLYKVTWSDYDAKKSVNFFRADSAAAAIAVVEDLTQISAASWIGLSEDGIDLQVASDQFGLAATAEAFENERALLEFASASSRSRHELSLPAVLPSYVNDQTLTTEQNPVGDLTLIKTSEGEPIDEFLRATYHYRNRDTKDI